MSRSSIPETPGGGGIKFLSSLRLLVKSIGRVDDPASTQTRKLPPIGIMVQVSIAKSSICRPFRDAVIPLYFEGDFDDDMAVWTYLLALPDKDPHRVVRKSGSWCYIRTEDGEEHNFYEKNLTDKIVELGCREYLRRHCLESIRGV